MLGHEKTNHIWMYILNKDINVRNTNVNLYIVICGLMIFDTIHLIDADPEDVLLLSKLGVIDADIFYIAALANDYIRKLKNGQIP